MEDRAVSQIVRPHRHDDENRHAGPRSGLEQQADEGVGFVAVDPLAEAKDLLELVDQKKQIGAAKDRRLVDDFGQSERAKRSAAST